jgi:Ca2+-transporting ATPase
MNVPSAPPWHALRAEQVQRDLDSGPTGLTETEAARRLGRFGPNRFERLPPASAWRILLAQLRNMVVALLAVAAGLALLTGDPIDAGAIAAVLVLNVAIGFITELRAHRAMEALVALEVSRARVLRGGNWREVDARELVPGDVINLEAGQSVPADARLLEAAALRVQEASLTGESVPAGKTAGAALAADVPLADRSTMVYKATTVVAGRAQAVVVATGMATEVGRIGSLAGSVGERTTPLERRLDQLGRRLALAALGVAVLVGALGYWQGLAPGELIQTALALAVAAVPEGLPAVATIAMAIGVRRMAGRKVLVRRLPVVETLGSATVICTDKTGTLTSGSMRAVVLRLPDREVELGTAAADGDSRVAAALRIGALANEAALTREGGEWAAHGDPTDVALLLAAAERGVVRDHLLANAPRTAELPFSSERQLAASWHRAGAGVSLYVKGAPGRILDASARVLDRDGPRTLDPARLEELRETNRGLAARGLRVLGLAMREEAAGIEADLASLTFVAFVGLSDPPAPGVRETVALFSAAGIRTVMITGDQQRTAETIARELGLLRPGDRVMDGRELDGLPDEILRDAVGSIGAYSRASPEAKLRIIAAHQSRGAVVAMLGDGVNDAAALRKADIGVAMGLRGTDMAKEAADLILEDDRFPTIGAAIEEGRVIFDNVSKFVFYLFSCNLAEILVLLGAGVVGSGVPLYPLQILWLNLLTDTFPALALAVEPGEPGVMRQAPRDPEEAILSGRMARSIVVYATLIAAVTVAAFALAGTTAAFMTLAFAQVLHLGNARRAGPVLAPGLALANRAAVGAVLLVGGLQLLAAFFDPLARVLRIAPLSGREWLLVVTLGALPAAAGQAMKALRRLRARPERPAPRPQ